MATFEGTLRMLNVEGQMSPEALPRDIYLSTFNIRNVREKVVIIIYIIFSISRKVMVCIVCCATKM